MWWWALTNAHHCTWDHSDPVDLRCPYVQCTKNRLTCENYIVNHKILQEHQLNSRFLVFPAVVDTPNTASVSLAGTTTRLVGTVGADGADGERSTSGTAELRAWGRWWRRMRSRRAYWTTATKCSWCRYAADHCRSDRNPPDLPTHTHTHTQYSLTVPLSASAHYQSLECLQTTSHRPIQQRSRHEEEEYIAQRLLLI